MAPLTLARSWSALGLYRPQFPHLKHGLKTSPSAGQGLLESMSPERCVQEPKGSDTLSQTTLPHQGPLSLLSTPMGLGGGQGEWAGRPCKGAPAVPPSFITPSRLLPSPSLSYQEGGSKSLEAEAQVTTALGPPDSP